MSLGCLSVAPLALCRSHALQRRGRAFLRLQCMPSGADRTLFGLRAAYRRAGTAVRNRSKRFESPESLLGDCVVFATPKGARCRRLRGAGHSRHRKAVVTTRRVLCVERRRKLLRRMLRNVPRSATVVPWIENRAENEVDGILRRLCRAR